MADHHVTCVHLSGPTAAHRSAITHLGASNWLLTCEEVSASMGHGERFFIVDPRTLRQVWIEARNEPGEELLQAKVEGLGSEGLRVLPECHNQTHKHLGAV